MVNCNLIYRIFCCKTVHDLIFQSQKKQEVHGVHHSHEKVTSNKHICPKLWLYHNLDHEKKSLSPFWELNVTLFEKKTPLHTPSLKDANNCTRFVWNWPSSSGEGELFKILSMYFCFFIIISPWKRAWPFVWTKWKHLHPSKDAFVPSLDEIGSVFLEKMIMWKKIKTDRWKTDNRWSGIGILIVCFTSLMRRSQTARPWHFINGVLCIVISCLLCFCTLLC